MKGIGLGLEGRFLDSHHIQTGHRLVIVADLCASRLIQHSI